MSKLGGIRFPGVPCPSVTVTVCCEDVRFISVMLNTQVDVGVSTVVVFGSVMMPESKLVEPQAVSGPVLTVPDTGTGKHEDRGEWWWVNAIPKDVEIDSFYLSV